MSFMQNSTYLFKNSSLRLWYFSATLRAYPFVTNLFATTKGILVSGFSCAESLNYFVISCVV